MVSQTQHAAAKTKHGNWKRNTVVAGRPPLWAPLEAPSDWDQERFQEHLPLDIVVVCKITARKQIECNRFGPSPCIVTNIYLVFTLSLWWMLWVGWLIWSINVVAISGRDPLPINSMIEMITQIESINQSMTRMIRTKHNSCPRCCDS